MNITKLINTVNTPCIVYSERQICQTIKKIYDDAREVQNFKLYYSVKANSCLEVIKTISRYVDGVELASKQEYEIADDLHMKERIITIPAITADFLKRVYDDGFIEDFNSLSMLKEYSTILQGRRIGVRIVFPEDDYSRFGINCMDESFGDILERRRVSVGRIHYHNSEYTVQKIRAICDYILEVRERCTWFEDVSCISFGGGLYMLYKSDMNERNMFWRIVSGFAKEINERQRIDIVFEPGTLLVMESGFLVCTALDSWVERNKQVVILDSSAFNLFSWYLPNLLYPPDISGVKTMICGCSCFEDDIFVREKEIPIVKRGDRLVFSHVGAYATSMNRHLHQLPPPEEIICPLDS